MKNPLLAVKAAFAALGAQVPIGFYDYKVHGRPGRVTLYTHHKKIGRSKYMPHQGKRECARRRRQMGVS